ncbi:MAG: magnesium-translocating P-type ATPase [Eubacteriaceae bacterium]|nr:magnesium-translocating P-type ATPase [Eubacteriaceae bacterium]
MAKKKTYQQVSTTQQRATRRLINASQKDPATLLIQYDNSFDGYDEEKVEEMRDQYGINVITKHNEETVFTRLKDAFVNPFTIVLFVLSAISFVSNDIQAVIIVMSMVIVSGLLRFFQEQRSSVAAEKLGEMVETTAAVMRCSEETSKPEKKELPLDEIVVGDVVHLAAGDIIPADIRIIQAKDLFVSQSSLTGESEPVEKFPTEVEKKTTNLLDLNNLAFMGSTVVSGSAIAIVLAVGDDTSLGAIASQLQGKAPPTSFEKGVNEVSWLLIRFMLVMVPFVFILNGFTKHDWLEAFLFAVSIAVGLTPEMLPMIVSANLAKGAVSMSKKQVIVKELSSIQNLGAMDVLCTDKTGTLTQDRIILEYHMDIHGNSDDRVLRHAYLNSYYQTGLKNLMDISIIERALEEEVITANDKFRKVDEIPFDFGRRRMSVVVADDKGKTQLIAKGAIEEMLSISSFVEYQGNVEPMTEALRDEIMGICTGYSEDGLRILGVAQKNNISSAGAVSVSDEADMVLIGYLAFLDPPKESAAAAIEALHSYGVDVKVLTGDSDAVTESVCRQVGLPYENTILGSDLDNMGDTELSEIVETHQVFAKLSPSQKTRVVTALRMNGHTVGYLGDGINDASAMRASDVGISVDTAVDIAKESARIILLEKDLNVLEKGVIEGRKIYANIIKYIKMTASSNFGNVFSVVAASAFLPFMPMLPIHILLLNLIYDTACASIPWDNVDKEFLAVPRKWDASSIGKFMLWIGPTSSIFDITTYLLMYYIICPLVCGGQLFPQIADPAVRLLFIATFQAGWFIESMWSQTLVIHMIRTPKIPFIQSWASVPVVLSTLAGIVALTVIPFTPFGASLGLAPLPAVYFSWLAATILAYILLVTLIKAIFVKKYGELL